MSGASATSRRPRSASGSRSRRDRELNPLTGAPLRRRLRRFQAEADRYLASLGGPLPYMQRLRRIEEETAAVREQLAEATNSTGDDPAELASARRALGLRRGQRADRAPQPLVYPIEARLPMDPRSRDFVPVGGRPYRRERLDAAWVLEQLRRLDVDLPSTVAHDPRSRTSTTIDHDHDHDDHDHEDGPRRSRSVEAEREQHPPPALAQIRQYPDVALRMKAHEVTEFDESCSSARRADERR